MRNNYIIIKKVLIILVWLINIANLSSQEFIPSDFSNYYFTPKNIGLSTPQVTDMIKYGNQNVNYYNGLLDTSIPLDGYKDNDFDIPLSLKYISSGFVPSKRPNIVGHNWVLNFGGIISRTVNGSPDDTKGYYTGKSSGLNKYIKDGMLVSVKNQSFKQYSLEDLLTFNIDKNKNGGNTPYLEDSMYDLEPDIFKFSFGNHQGSFIINNSGKISLLSGDTQYKIDISNLTVQEYSTTEAPQPSTIFITTPNGYIYEFGGDISYLEYFIPSNPKDISVRPRYITSWYLKSIKSPNKRVADFAYTSILQPYRYNTFVYSYQTITYHPPTGGMPKTSGDSKQISMEDKVFTPIFNNLKVDGDLRIKFDIKDHSRFYDDEDSFSKSLDTISYYYNKKRLKSIEFDYLNKGGYFFLSQINNTDGGKYGFDYNLDKDLPSPLTISLDHWGFWNGGNIVKESNPTSYCYNIEENRKVNPLYADVSLLNKITYPTYGYSEIKYEPNYYTRYHIRDNQKIHINQFETKADTVCGGARVKSVTDYDFVTKQPSNSRTFYYRKCNTTKGSGIIGLKPKYRIDERMVTRVTQNGILYDYITDYIDISANTFGSNNLFEEYHIGYSDIVEEFQDGSYNYYNYSSFIDIPDEEDTTYGINKLNYQSSLNNVVLAEKHRLYMTNDMSRYRGQLLSKTVYSRDDNTLQLSTYKYNTDVATSSYNVSVSYGPRGHAAYKIYLKPLLLKEEQIIDSNNTVITKKYYYNKQNQVSTQEMSNSDNLFWSLSHRYITDFPYQRLSAPGQKLYDKNIINTPFFTLKTIRDTIDNRILVVDAVTYDYKIEHDLPLIYNLYKLDTSTPVSEGGSAFNSNLQIRETYHNYDSYGNPIYMTKDGVTKVVYLWGYNGQYPIAEIKNSTYEDVKKALKVDPESLSSAPEPKMDLVNSLRTELPRAQITTYTYYPLIGMASVTDPRGITTKYSYGWGGKLHLVYTEEDGKEKLLKQYEYELPGYLHLRPSPPVYPEPEELTPDPYTKGNTSSIFLNIEATGSSSYGTRGWNYDSETVKFCNVIQKTYKTIEVGECIWTTENVRLKYTDRPNSISLNWINFTQADIDKLSADHLGGRNIPLDEFEQVYGSWTTLDDDALMYRNITWGARDVEGGLFLKGWGLPTKEDIWQLYGQAPRTTDNVYNDIKDFLFASSSDFNFGWAQGLFKNKNISGLTLTPLGMRESSQTGAIYGFGQVTSLQTSTWAAIETLSDRDLSGKSGLISNPDSYHFTQARHRRPLTDQELGYKMYIDAANDQVLMLPYNQLSTLPELPKGLERGVALRYANRKAMKVVKKWTEIQAEAAMIMSKITKSS